MSGNLGFTKIIDAIESEISAAWMPGVIDWADKHLDGAWTKAMERFDANLTLAIERKDYRLAEAEGAFYKTAILEILAKFREYKQVTEAEAVLLAMDEDDDSTDMRSYKEHAKSK